MSRMIAYKPFICFVIGIILMPIAMTEHILIWVASAFFFMIGCVTLYQFMIEDDDQTTLDCFKENSKK